MRVKIRIMTIKKIHGTCAPLVNNCGKGNPSSKLRPCLDGVNAKHKFFINHLHGVLNVVEK